MPLAIIDDHKALSEVARSFLAGRRAAARELLDAETEPLPAFWKELASAVLAEAGPAELRELLLPGLADGSRVGAIGLTDELVLGGGLADVLLLVDGDDVLVFDAGAVEREAP